ncbi:MAG: T9SS type A sorting domain-containing protein [Bacteroidia bacterium]|nr:T9SS type A sorting domain-containing protein [Bacteroidia bacterium]
MKGKLQQFNWRMLYVFPMVFLLTGLVGNDLFGQSVTDYIFSTSTGTTLNAMTGAVALSPTDRDDGVSAVQNIGFNFTYEGTVYTQFSASVDGFIRLGGTQASAQFSNLITSTTNIPKIFPYWDDLALGTNGTLRTALVGTAPNQIRVVEWFVTVPRNTAGTANSTFQLFIYETTNLIEFRYGTMLGPTISASIGLRGAVATPAAFHSVTVTTNTTSTTTANNANTAVPASGRMYTFAPPVPCTGTPVGGTAVLGNIPGCGTGNFNLSVNGATVAPGISYQWQSSPDSINWTNLLNDTLVGLSGAPVSTLTYFRRITTCNPSSQSSNSGFTSVKPVYGGVASATTPVCGDSLTLSLTSISANISAIQWESSTDNIVFTPIFGATLTTQKVPTPLANTWYRAVVTCTASSSTDNSVSVAVRPARGGTTSLVSSFCLDSTTLNLTNASTGPVTYSWLSSVDSITWVPMNITTATARFASPTATRFYRCVVACGTATDTSIALRVNEPCQGFGPYSITRNTGVTFTSIQSTGTTFNWSGTSADDDRTLPVYFPAGFNFSYAGAVRPAFYISTNGWLSFDTSVISTTFTNDLNSTVPRLVLAPFWDDLFSLGGSFTNRNNLIRYSVTGTTPNRVMTIEWAEMELWSYPAPSINFQIKLYEGSNNIEYVYGRMQPFDGTGTGGFSYSIGMNGNSPLFGQRLSLLLENSRNFSTTTVNNNLTIAPLCNTSYLFTSGAAFNPSNTSPIPANDSSLAPVLLSVNPIPCTDACGTYYSTRGASASGSTIAPVSGNADDDVWFSFVAPTSGQVNVSIVGSPGFDPAFMVMNNLFDTVGLGAAASRNANTTAIESVQATNLTAGSTYLVRVFNAGVGSGSTSGSFSICVNEIIPPPANDDTSGAVVLTVGTACNPTTGTTIGASASSQAVCGGLADDDVWYRFTPSASVDTVTVNGTGTFRAHVQVLTRLLTSISCVNTTVNAGTVKITLTNLLKDSTYYIRVYHTNAGTASGGFNICVNGVQATAPIVTTGTKTNVITTSATVAGTISDGGFAVTLSGIVYSTTPAPVLNGVGVVDSTNNPVITNGSFSRNIAGLLPATTYYYRTYARNVIGTTYGPDSSFTTLASAIPPIVSTLSAINLSTVTATVRGNISSNGGDPVTASGVVYSTSGIPTIGAPGVIDSTTNPLVTANNFSLNLAGLTHSTKYYFRAYATNTAGTGYGALDSFTTLPIISTLPYTENFDGATTPWVASSVNLGTNSWVRGTPAKTFINGAFSAPNAFVTTLTGSYLGSENCAVTSPQFDFTSFTTDPIIRFRNKFKTDIDPDWDGGVLEISINNGPWSRLDSITGTATNFNTTNSHAWYNNAAANGTLSAHKFNGISSSYSSATNGWVESATRLTGAAGQNNVRVRFRFWADGLVDEGWAIDNIEVVEVVAPTVAASAVTATPGNTNALVNFTAGNGQGRLVVARLATTTAVAPTNNTLYTANAVFGSGSTTGTGNFVVFSGSGTSVNITGLTQLTGYQFDVYEYNGRYMHIQFAPVANGNTTTLPVNLVSFNGRNNKGDVKLNWTTAGERNNRGFYVERSIDGKSFTEVGFVKGNITTAVVTNYTHTDEQAFVINNTNKLFYRLRQVDLDGKFNYSNVIVVLEEASDKFAVSAYPVPFTNELSINVNSTSTDAITVEVYDVQGRLLLNQVQETVINNVINVNNINQLQSGVYLVKVSQGGTQQTIRIVKQ